MEKRLGSSGILRKTLHTSNVTFYPQKKPTKQDLTFFCHPNKSFLKLLGVQLPYEVQQILASSRSPLTRSTECDSQAIRSPWAASTCLAAPLQTLAEPNRLLHAIAHPPILPFCMLFGMFLHVMRMLPHDLMILRLEALEKSDFQFSGAQPWTQYTECFLEAGQL